MKPYEFVPLDKLKNFDDIKNNENTNDTDNIVEYLNNEDSSNKKKYKFWELLKRNENWK